MTYSTGSVGLARRSENSDTNFYLVNCEVLVEAIDDDQALNQVRDAIIDKFIAFKWTSTHLAPKILEG